MEIDEKITLIGQKYTFAGVLYQYFEEIAARWNDNTRKAYLGQYQGQILPRLADRPLEEYTREDFDQVISDIDTQYTQRNSGQRYAANTLQHYRYLIRIVLKAAAALELFVKWRATRIATASVSINPPVTVAMNSMQEGKPPIRLGFCRFRKDYTIYWMYGGSFWKPCFLTAVCI